jgi:hypothetical protein
MLFKEMLYIHLDTDVVQQSVLYFYFILFYFIFFSFLFFSFFFFLFIYSVLRKVQPSFVCPIYFVTLVCSVGQKQKTDYC